MKRKASGLRDLGKGRGSSYVVRRREKKKRGKKDKGDKESVYCC